MISQTLQPCFCLLQSHNRGKLEATFPAKEGVPSCLMITLTNECLSWTRPGVSLSMAPIRQAQNCSVLEEGRNKRVGYQGLLVSQGRRTPESLPVFSLYFFLPRWQKCFPDFNSPTSILFHCSQYCFTR